MTPSNQTGGGRPEKSFYDTFWREQSALACDEKCRLRFILAALADLVPNAPPAGDAGGCEAPPPSPTRLKIADVGCGRGWLTELLSHFGETTGFDLSTSEASKRYPQLKFVECDILELPPGNFDVAVCSEVIEHVRREEQRRLVLALSSILREGGTLILTTPNLPEVSTLVERLSLEKELQPVEDWLDAEALKSLVSERFCVQELTTLMFFPVSARRIRLLSRLYRLVYEQWGTYRFVDPPLGRTRRGLYIGLVGKRMTQR